MGRKHSHQTRFSSKQNSSTLPPIGDDEMSSVLSADDPIGDKNPGKGIKEVERMIEGLYIRLSEKIEKVETQLRSELVVGFEEIHSELRIESKKREDLEQKVEFMSEVLIPGIKQTEDAHVFHENTNMNANAQAFNPSQGVQYSQDARYYQDNIGYEPQVRQNTTRWPAESRSNARTYQDNRSENVKIRSFNPIDIDWYNYKSYFEAIAAQSNWTDRTKCTKLLGALPTSLTGVVAGLKTPFAYCELRDRLDASQSIANAREDAQIKLTNCVKDSNEAIPMFSERVRQLAERAYPHYAESDKDTHALQAFIHGMASHSETFFQLRVQVFKSLQEATNFALRVEQAMKPLPGSERKRAFMVRRTEDETNETDLGAESLANVIKNSTEEMRKISDSLKKTTFQHQESRQLSRDDYNSERRTIENSPCHACGQMGHWKPQCPNRGYRYSTNPTEYRNQNYDANSATNQVNKTVPLNSNRTPLWDKQEAKPQ